MPETCSPPQSPWLKAPGETQGHLEGFGTRGREGPRLTTAQGHRRSWGAQTMSQTVGTKAQLLLAPGQPVLCWMFRGQDLHSLWSSASSHPSEALHPPPRTFLSSATFASNPSVPPQHHRAGAAQAPRASLGLECTEGPRGHDLPLGSSSAGSEITNKKEPLAIVSRGRGVTGTGHTAQPARRHG